MDYAKFLTAGIFLLATTAHGFSEPEKPKESPPAAPKEAPAPNALSTDMEATLRKAGFSDLEILPNSVLVRGKDKTGKPVAMVIHPGSMTEMITIDPHSGSSAGGNGKPLTGSGTFTTVLQTERLASTLIGLTVRDRQGETVGTIKDLAIDHDGVHAYILGTGGVMGLGDRYVALSPSAIDLAYDSGTKTYRATTDTTAERLKSAPDFKYEGSFQAKGN